MRSLIVILVLAAARDAAAEQCVSRRKFGAETSRDGKLDGGNLVFCTGDNCWAMDPATRAFRAIAKIPKTRKRDSEEVDPTGRAKAKQTGVEFCPTKDTCKSYGYKFKFVGALTAAINTEGTLGAVTFMGDSMENQPTWVMLYDLVKKKEVKRLQSAGAEVFARTFLVDETFYSAAGKPIGKLGSKISWDAGPVRIANSSLMAATEKFKSQLHLIDTATAKVAHTVDLKLAAAKGEVIDPYLIVSSADGAHVHVIAGGPNTGEVITVETATGKEVARSAPPICK